MLCSETLHGPVVRQCCEQAGISTSLCAQGKVREGEADSRGQKEKEGGSAPESAVKFWNIWSSSSLPSHLTVLSFGALPGPTAVATLFESDRVPLPAFLPYPGQPVLRPQICSPCPDVCLLTAQSWWADKDIVATGQDGTSLREDSFCFQAKLHKTCYTAPHSLCSEGLTPSTALPPACPDSSLSPHVLAMALLFYLMQGSA